MRNFARLCLTGVAVACSALFLSGCVQPVPAVTPAATSSSKPLFASDEEALAAATKAYAAYLQMSDLIAQEGGASPERLAPLVTSEWLKKEVAVFEKFATTNRHQLGVSTFNNVVVQQVYDNLSAEAVTVYLCEDVSATRFADASGQDVTPLERQVLVSLEVTLQEKASEKSSLVISEIQPWSGSNAC